MYIELERERRRLRPGLIAALRSIAPTAVELSQWLRFVTYQHSLEPLSCAGSLQNIGGRFNAGAELDHHALKLRPWPALYLAQDYETAFREKFQLPSSDVVDGLTPQDLALEHGVSHTVVRVQASLRRVFDMTSHQSLVPVAQVLQRIKMPAQARQIQKKLKISSRTVSMVKTSQQVYDTALTHNWRLRPIQFGLPAHSQVLAELIRAAGFEAILYQSTKGPGQCLAVFPDLLNDGSFIELMDTPPPAVQHQRLDSDSAAELEGWQSLPPSLR